jgi:hypothetical protein
MKQQREQFDKLLTKEDLKNFSTKIELKEKINQISKLLGDIIKKLDQIIKLTFSYKSNEL